MYESHQHPAFKGKKAQKKTDIEISPDKLNKSYDSEDHTQMHENYETGLSQDVNINMKNQVFKKKTALNIGDEVVQEGQNLFKKQNRSRLKSSINRQSREH